MMAWLWLIIHDSLCIIGIIYLVINQHPWWAVFLLILLATTIVKTNKK